MQEDSSVPGLPRRFASPMVIIGILFFVFGFVTWLGAILIPYLQIACQLNIFESYLVTFAFYISYFIMAIPISPVLSRTGYKKGISLGLLFMAIGSLLFIPAAINRQYLLFLVGLFVQGMGLTLLQTAANPYVTILGPRESAAKRMSFMGMCNGVAAVLGPLVLGSVILENADKIGEQAKLLSPAERIVLLDELGRRVILPYAIITIVLVLLAVLAFFSGLPEINSDPEEDAMMEAEIAAVAAVPGGATVPALAQGGKAKTSIFQFPHLLLGVLTLFLYVGVEVIAGDTVINYGVYYHIPLSSSRYFGSLTQIFMLIGYLVGAVCIPKYLSQEKALRYSSVLGIFFALTALMTSGAVSVVFVSLCGFANAMIWPSIWPLAISGLGKFTKIASSMLIMAIGGGAILPLLYGYLAGKFDKHHAYWIVIPCYLAILLYAYKGHKVRTT